MKTWKWNLAMWLLGSPFIQQPHGTNGLHVACDNGAEILMLTPETIEGFRIFVSIPDRPVLAFSPPALIGLLCHADSSHVRDLILKDTIKETIQ